MEFLIRRAEPGDYPAVHQIFLGPNVVAGTLQTPFPSIEAWRKRLADPSDGTIHLVACVGDEIVGELGLHTFPNIPRRRHVGKIGMGVREDWQGKGAGTAADAGRRWTSRTIGCSSRASNSKSILTMKRLSSSTKISDSWSKGGSSISRFATASTLMRS